MGRLRDRLRRARWVAGTGSDLRSFMGLLRLQLVQPPRHVIDVRLRQLGGQAVTVRAGTADLWSIEALTPPVHLPPRELPRDRVRVVWDLGANIGLTMCHLAIECPQARIIGVEMDRAHAALCQRNIAPLGTRCELVEGAVWHRDGHVDYVPHEVGRELGFHIVEDDQQAEARRAKTITLDSLLDRDPDEGMVDYVKMDIEGAEAQVLRSNTDWSERVRTIKVEVHPPYTIDDCRQDLERLGFRTQIDPGFDPGLIDRMPPVVGIRE